MLFKVVRVKESVQKDELSGKEQTFYYTKIVHSEVIETVFGNKPTKVTFYVKGDLKLTVGQDIEVDLKKFEIKEYASEIEDSKTGKTIVRNCKWLHVPQLKVA